jgi:endoglucanase
MFASFAYKSKGFAMADPYFDFSASPKKYVSARFYSDSEFFSKEKEYGVSMDAVIVYRPIYSVGFQYIKTEGKQLQLVLEFKDTTLDEISGGMRDSQIRDLARDIKDGGKEVWIRPLHEFNLASNVYPWCIFPYTPAKIYSFKRAWRHVVQIFRDEHAPVKFQLCYNAVQPYDDDTPYSDFYPGDDVVDQVGVDVYNRAGIDRWHTEFKSLDKCFSAAYDQLVKFGKPIFIGETSSSDRGGDKAKWIRDAWYSLETKFDRVIIINWFLENKGSMRWGLNTDGQKEMWARGVEHFQNS